MIANSSTNQNIPPAGPALARALGDTKALWDELIRHIETTYPPVTHRWSASKTSAFGLLRLITPEADKAREVVERAGYAATVTEVVALQVPDRPGGLASVLDVLEPHGISVEYMYAFAMRASGDAVMVFRFDDIDRAISVLQAAGVNVFKSVDLFGN